MGIYQEKYTTSYFTGKNTDGTPAGYGVEGFEEFMNGAIRHQDKLILSKIDFAGKCVLEFGFGRGEAIKYVMDHGAKHYDGVDFALPALEIAQNFLRHHKIEGPELHVSDALEYMKRCSADKVYDVVIMLDFVEHIPRSELSQLLMLLKKHLSDTAVILINTPVYRADNDVVTEGLNPINEVSMIDRSNFIPETIGMHCNLYTVPSLQKYMSSYGYNNITEVHYYEVSSKITPFQLEKPFNLRWEAAKERGIPLIDPYEPDALEYAYVRDFMPYVQTFNAGTLKDLTFIMNDSYSNAFEHGNYGADFILHMKKFTEKNSVVFDVGGFMGMSSLLAKKHLNYKVYCFEPNPWNFNRIMHNLSYNNEISGDVETFHLGFGDKHEEISLLFSDSIDNGHSSSSLLTWGSASENPYETFCEMGFMTESVKVYTLDMFTDETGVIPHVIKIGIKGAEALILAGATETLQKHKPILYIELHSVLDATRCMRVLSDLSYDASVLSQESDGRIMIAAQYSDKMILQSVSVENKLIAYEYESIRLSKAVSDQTILNLSKGLKLEKENHLNTQENLAQAQEQLTQTQEQLAYTQEQLTQTHEHLADTQEQLHQAQVQLSDTQRQLTQTNWQLANTQGHLTQIRDQLAATQGQLVAMEMSTSWRITAPMRKIKRTLSK